MRTDYKTDGPDLDISINLIEMNQIYYFSPQYSFQEKI